MKISWLSFLIIRSSNCQKLELIAHADNHDECTELVRCGRCRAVVDYVRRSAASNFGILRAVASERRRNSRRQRTRFLPEISAATKPTFQQRTRVWDDGPTRLAATARRKRVEQRREQTSPSVRVASTDWRSDALGSFELRSRIEDRRSSFGRGVFLRGVGTDVDRGLASTPATCASDGVEACVLFSREYTVRLKHVVLQHI